MSIYTRFGSPVEVIADCGECQPEGYRATLTLLKVRYTESKEEGYYFMEFLKASDAWSEIQRAIWAAPDVTLTSEEFNKAIEEAK